DGRVLWRTDVCGIAWPRPAVSDKLVYASTAGTNPYYMRHLGGLVALDRASGKIRWRWPTPQTSSLFDGFLAGPVIEANMRAVARVCGLRSCHGCRAHGRVGVCAGRRSRACFCYSWRARLLRRRLACLPAGSEALLAPRTDLPAPPGTPCLSPKLT